jgi:hypothetical protein
MRVIARLKMERDEARAALASEPAQASKRTMDGDAMEMDTQGGKKAKAGITSDVVDTMTALSKELSKWRKKRPAQPSLATPEALASYTCLSSQPLHKTSPAGIAACDLMPNRPTVVATAGNDGQVNAGPDTRGIVRHPAYPCSPACQWLDEPLVRRDAFLPPKYLRFLTACVPGRVAVYVHR